MLALSPPQSTSEEDRKIKVICKTAEWSSYAAKWHNCYVEYRKFKGNPWLVNPVTFPSQLSQKQYDFYKSRAQGGPFQRIRNMKGLLCCPMCGSHTTGTLDHYLPREEYREFSILPCNLVPACAHCNSGKKGKKYKGAKSPERFLHPYYDKIAKNEIWSVDINPPYAAATFQPSAILTKSSSTNETLTFHLENIFGEPFQIYMANQLAVYPSLLANQDPARVSVTVSDVASFLSQDLKYTKISMGTNGWRTALLRGICANKDLQKYLGERATEMLL